MIVPRRVPRPRRSNQSSALAVLAVLADLVGRLFLTPRGGWLIGIIPHHKWPPSWTPWRFVGGYISVVQNNDKGPLAAP